MNFRSWLRGKKKTTPTDSGQAAVKAVQKPSHEESEDGPLEIDLNSIPYLPLPRAPKKWEETKTPAVREPQEGMFEVVDAHEWSLGVITKLPMKERPDTAYRELQPINHGMFMVDRRGRVRARPEAKSNLLRFDRDGRIVSQKGLVHDIYRINVNPLGDAVIGMSRDCSLHGYDGMLNLIIDLSLMDTREIRRAMSRLGIGEEELKNHVRCVGVSRNQDRFLFTVVDEVWCLGVNRSPVWGAKLPIQDGWKEVAEPSHRFGMSGEIDDAMNLIGLGLPVTPDDIKHQYRKLAKRWHPDLNPEDPSATQRMQDLQAAFELLTGVDPASLSETREAASYFKEDSTFRVDLGDRAGLEMSIGFGGGPRTAADWIYAANFAGTGESVYVAGYSGKIVLLDRNGVAVRAYDIGAVPRRIVDTGDYLYFLTDTRLYVLRDESLHAIIDVFQEGDLVVGQTGFGLLDKYKFQWYQEDGKYIGSVLSKHPIRRVYHTGDHLVVETRQHRVQVIGAPTWWEEIEFSNSTP